MHNSYISSNLFSLRSNVSLSFSFSDVSNLLNDRFERDPFLSSCCCVSSSSCCCCSCCCGSLHANCRVHINPSLFYGLRQSRIIQRPPSRRLILSGRERYYCRVPSYGIDSCDYEVSCSFKERSDGGRVEKLGKGKFGGVSSRERRWFSRVDDVDAVISLLNEEVSEEHLGGGGSNWGSVNRGDVEKVEKREGYGGGFRRGRKHGARLELLDSDSKDESVSVEMRKEGYHWREEKAKRKQYRKYEKEEEKAALGSAYCKGQKGSSSFSSYCSVSSSGEFESDKEAQDVHGDFQEESSSEYRKELTSGAGRFEKNVEEEIRSRRECVDAKKEALEQKSGATRSGVEWDLRKKTEKKFTDCDETVSLDESDYRKASSSYKKIQEKVEKSSEFNVKKGARARYSQVAENVEEQSGIRQNYQRITDVQETYHKNDKLTFQSQKQDLSKEGNLSLEENLDASHKIGNEKAKLGSRSQNLVETVEIRKLDGGRMSQQQGWSESRMKFKEEDGAVMSSRARNEQHYKAAEQVSGLTETRRSSGKFSTVTDANDSHSKKTSISSSGIAVKNHQGSTSIASTSGLELKAHKSSGDQRNVQMIQLSQESQDVTNISVNVTNVSVVHGGHAEMVKGSQRTTDKTSNQGSDFSSFVKPVQQQIGTDNANERVTGFQSTNDGQRAASALGFFERSAQQVTVAESSLNMLSQLNVQEMDIEHEDEKNRRITQVTPPGGKTTTSSQELFEADWNVEIHRNPSKILSPGDALGSAQRLEEASAQFVGEYFERAKHEASTSKILQEKTLSDTKLEHESEKDRQNESGSEGIQLKELDSRRSSRGSGVKGPSDEMWDTRDSSHQESPETEALEGVVADENAAIRRTGKSLWNMIANIVTLRWHSHAETPKSVQKSGGKSSSNDSVSSEAWFSGNEPDESSNENANERRSTLNESTPSDHLRQKQTPIKGKLEVADSMSQLKADASSSLVGLESRMTSTGFLSHSDEKNLPRNEESRVVQVQPSHDEESGVVQVHPSGGINLPQDEESRVVEIGSSPLMIIPTGVMSGGISDEACINDETATSSSRSGTQTEQHVALKISDERLGSKGNEGELKQRRFQRNPQIPRDRFDAWEEAYILEKEQRKVDEFFMKEALLEAKKAADTWEVPVGAVLVQHGNIIARGYNLVEELRDSTAHAEMICIREASNLLRSWRLAETTLYVTLEPCPMCAGAILQARIDTLVWGAPNKLLGADGSWIRLLPDGGEGGGSSQQSNNPAAPVHPFHPNITVRRGILASECADVMQQFFQLRRKKKVKEDDQPPQPSCLPIANSQSKILTKMHHIFHSLLCL